MCKSNFLLMRKRVSLRCLVEGLANSEKQFFFNDFVSGELLQLTPPGKMGLTVMGEKVVKLKVVVYGFLLFDD